MNEKSNLKRFIAILLACALFCALPVVAFAEAGSGVPAQAAGEPPVQEPPEEQPPVEQPPAEEPSAEQSAAGAAGESAVKTVSAFAALAEDVAAQTVDAGAALTDLNLPTALAATVDGQAAAIEGITWREEPAFDGNAPGEYAFTAKLPEGYALAEGVATPAVCVTVRAAEQAEPPEGAPKAPERVETQKASSKQQPEQPQAQPQAQMRPMAGRTILVATGQELVDALDPAAPGHAVSGDTVEVRGYDIILNASATVSDGVTLSIPEGNILTTIANMNVYGTVACAGTINVGSSMVIYSGGELNVSGGTTTVSGGGGINLNGGEMNVTGGAVNVLGTILVGSGSKLNVSGGTTTVSGGGTITLHGAMNVTGGTVNVENTSGTGITLGGAMNVAGGTVNVENTSGTGITLGGTLAVSKQGALVLKNTGGNGLVWGNGTLSGAIANNGTFVANPSAGVTLSYGGTMSGGGSVEKMQEGTLALTGANEYTGGTSVSGGLAAFANGNNFGDGNISLNGGGLQWMAGSTTDISGRLSGIGANGATFDTNGNNVTFATALSGSGRVTKQGAGTLTLADGSNYTGGTTVSGGTLVWTGDTIPSMGDFTINSGATLEIGEGGYIWWQRNIVNNGTLHITRDSAITVHEAVTISGSGRLVKEGSYPLGLDGPCTYTGETIVKDGRLRINAPHTGGGDFTVKDEGGVEVAESGSLGSDVLLEGKNSGLAFNVAAGGSLTHSKSISGAGSVYAWGSGALTLSGTNTYTGDTKVEGLLTLQSSFTNKGTITVENGGALQNDAVLVNEGTLTSEGDFIVNPAGTLQNKSNGTVVNNGTLTVGGTAQNSGVIKGRGTYDGINALKTIKADANGGVIDGDTYQIYAEPQGTAAFDLAKLDTPARAAQTFVDWFATASGGIALTSPHAYNDKDTVYAQWTANVTSVTLDPASKTAKPGDTFGLTATISPGDAADKGVAWQSSDESVVSVAANGLSATATAKKPGTATITVATNDGGKTAACAVTVSLTDYPVTSGFPAFTGSGDRRATVDADAAKFVRLWNGSAEIGKGNYEIAAGSTVITLREAYLKTLKNGTYEIAAEFTDGTARLALVVDVPRSATSPQTGDNTMLWLWVALAAQRQAV